jgi:hypothetical protein
MSDLETRLAELRRRIDAALTVASENAMYDGEDHKMWCLDQMVRNLTGCPLISAESTDGHGQPYTYMELGESEEYREFTGGEAWDEGCAP